MGSFIAANLRHHRRAHFAAGLGAALATAVVTGSLVVGDSVRGSLRDQVGQRLGRTTHALDAGDRTVRAALAPELARAAGIPAAALWHAAGTVSAPDRDRRLARADVLGVDAAFDTFAGTTNLYGALASGECVLNDLAAARLDARPGDAVVVRVPRATALPADVPLGAEKDPHASIRAVVRAVAGPAALGRFSLRAQQLAAPAIFLPREDLARRLDAPGRANLLLASADAAELEPDWTHLLHATMRMADFGLSIANLPSGAREIRSRRVFLEPAVERAARGAAPGAVALTGYFVNEIRAGDRTCPYSFAATMPPGLAPADLPADEAVINAWLADDLGVSTGATLRVAYFVPGPGLRLLERTNEFRVRAIVPLAGAADDPALMPDLPGVSDAATCAEWDSGMPIDFTRIRDRDEAYWKEHRGTPKLFVSPAAAMAMWSNRFGMATAVRYPAGTDAGRIESGLHERLWPEALGLMIRQVRNDGLRAGATGVDFGGLFLGLGFFILAAALMLAGLLYSLGLTARATEIGTLRAMGFRPRRVAQLILGEAAAVALLAAVAGAAGGIGFTALVLRALRTVWRGAVGTTELALYANPGTLAAGAAAGFVCALGVMAITLRRLRRREVIDLIQSDVEPPFAGRPGCPRRRLAAGLACLAAAAFPLVMPAATWERHGAELLPMTGALGLAGGLLLLAAWLARLGQERGTAAPALFGPRNWARRPRRSLAAAIMPACGVFLVAAVGAYRPDAGRRGGERSSGTGGYALHVETALPITRDPGAAEGRTASGLDVPALARTSFTLLRMRPGDDASCLNLNRVSAPSILGVPTAAFAARGAFGFAALDPRADRADPWSCLALDVGPDAIPAVADQSVITWGLGRKLGDRIPFADERGQRVDLVLVGGLENSIFQGRLLVDDAAMQRHFPSAVHRVALVDVPAERRAAAAAALEDRWSDLGATVEPAEERLAAFLAVERTYLDIFLALGALGLLLGTAGFGVVAARNTLERRGEFALLRALGFRARPLARGARAENLLLALAGLGIGALASIPAAWPALRAAPGPAAWAAAAGLLLAFALGAASAVALAVRAVLRPSPLDALRAE